MVNNRLRPGLWLVLGFFQCYKSYRFEAKKGGGSLRIGVLHSAGILRQLSENTCLVYVNQRVDLAIFHNFYPQLTFDLIINNNNNSNNSNINNNFNNKTVKNRKWARKMVILAKKKAFNWTCHCISLAITVLFLSFTSYNIDLSCTSAVLFQCFGLGKLQGISCP